METPYNIGDKARITVLVANDGVAVDPSTLSLTVTDPSSNQSIYTYGVHNIVREAVGAYHFDVTIDELGTWNYSWELDGADYETGSFETGRTYVLEATDETPTALGYVDIQVLDVTQTEVMRVQTAENGKVSIFVIPGTYTFFADKFGYQFLSAMRTLAIPSAGPAADVLFLGALLVDTWLTVRDLERIVSRDVIDRLFQDSNSNVRDPELVQAIILEAQGLAESKLLRSWSTEQIKQLAFHDAAVRSNAAWIALELATERKGEFIASDGKGRYWVQYERAMAYFDSLSKSKDHSRGEKAATQLGVSGAGKGSNSGGRRKPVPQAGNNFVFADEGDGTKHGGF